MNNDEKKGYARGYAAGRKRVDRDLRDEAYKAERQAFLNSAFLAALPVCIDGQSHWKRGDVPITTLDARMALAWDLAESALKQRRYAK